MIPITIKKRNSSREIDFEIESQWEDISKEQLIFLGKCIVEKLPKDEVLKRFAYCFRKVGMIRFFQMNHLQRMELSSCYNFLFESATSKKVIIDSFRFGWKKYYGPGENLSNVKVLEWMCADNAAIKYLKNKREEDLSTLIAHLYRPLAKRPHSTDRREIYDENLCNDRVKIFDRLAPGVRYAILLNYMALRRQMAANFKDLFKNTGSGENFGIPGMIHDLSGPELGPVLEIQNNWYINNLLFIAQKNEMRRRKRKKAA